ncbi:alpha/beta fold hydrolase [Amnibacterium endophyticum]|uniref:Alpha/beta fold hydrolase n=1 Tax=Amnibacterium endophyticum TaxID=2109337 RepID=A0ABW4LBK6_9MICO
MRAATRETIEVDGHRVGVTVAGDGPPLVLLHGIGRDRDDWVALQPLLATRWTTYAVDLEGFGVSEPWGPSVTLASMAALVRRTLAALGETRPLHVVGNSLGGAVALRLAADDPASIAALVLISPAGFGREAVFGLRLLTVPGLGRALLALESTAPSLLLKRTVLDRDPVRRRLAVEAGLRLRRPGAKQAYLQVVHDLGGWGGIHEAWRRELLSALAASGVPALVLWGERDTVLPFAHFASVAEAVPHAVAESLPGFGHMPQLEDPELIAARIETFFAGLPGGEGLSRDGRPASAAAGSRPA